MADDLDARLDAAIAAISEPDRLAGAQELVARAAPALQKVLGTALSEGGWFDTAHNAAVREAAAEPELEDRVRRIRTLFAEETRLSMLVGVAVGVELARELADELEPLGYEAPVPDPPAPATPKED